MPPDPEREKELIRLRDQVTKIRNPPLPPLVRGFSGSKFPGQSVGTPERIGDCKWEKLFTCLAYDYFAQVDTAKLCNNFVEFDIFLFDFQMNLRGLILAC